MQYSVLRHFTTSAPAIASSESMYLQISFQSKTILAGNIIRLRSIKTISGDKKSAFACFEKILPYYWAWNT